MPRRVLIADDNEIIRKLVQSHIEELAGVEVCAAVGNGTEAVEAAIALRPHVLILDLAMPQLGGIQVAGALKKKLPRAKIILFTILSDAISPQMVTALGAKLVSKTDGLRALRRAVQEVLETRAGELAEALARAVRDRAIDRTHLDLLTRQFSSPLTRCGRDLKYLWVNDCYAKFLKRPVEKIVGRSILDVVGKNAFDLLQQHFDQVLRGENVSYEAEVDYESAGYRRITAAYKPTSDSSGSPDGWLAYVEDMTARTRQPGDRSSSPSLPSSNCVEPQSQGTPPEIS